MTIDALVTITISDLKILTLIGVFEEERRHVQPLIFDITLTYNAAMAMKSDNIDDALDYGHIESQIQALVQKSCYYLIERLADEILHTMLANEAVTSCSLTISKPNALKHSGAMVAVTASRSKN